MTAEQKVMVALCRGVAVWAAGDKLGWAAVDGKLPQNGLSWLKAEKSDLLRGLRPSNKGRLEREIRAGMGPAWLELYRLEKGRLKSEDPDMDDQEIRMKTWARALGTGLPLGWESLDSCGRERRE